MIFFSHSMRDRDWCDWLAREARKLGVEAYLAEHDRQPGRQLAAKVEEAIRRSDAVVVLLTESTAASSYVHQEVGYSLAHEKLVIPLVQVGIARSQLAMLDGVEYIEFDFRDPRPGHEGFMAALERVARQQKKQQDLQTLMAVGVCVALLVLLLRDGGAAAPT